MKKRKYFHVVTERPMFEGQSIILDLENKNGVARRVERVEYLRSLSETQRIPENEFDVVALKNFEYWCNLADRELVLEKVRKEKFRNYPSRMTCLYTSTDFDEAKKWAGYFRKAGRQVFSVVQLETSGASFTGDANNCWGSKVDLDMAFKNAFRYWTNGMNTRNLRPVHETIIDGEIRVVKIIIEYDWEG